MVFDAMRWDEMKWIVQYKDIQIKTEALAKAKAKTLAWYDNLGLMWMMCACIQYTYTYYILYVCESGILLCFFTRSPFTAYFHMLKWI